APDHAAAAANPHAAPARDRVVDRVVVDFVALRPARPRRSLAMRIEGPGVLVVVLDGVVAGHVVRAIVGSRAMALQLKVIVLDEDGVRGPKADGVVPAIFVADDRNPVAEIDEPVVVEDIVVDDSRLQAGQAARIAAKLDAGTDELGEA